MIDRTEFFTAKLTYETDASDVYTARKSGAEIYLVDVRSKEAWAQGRIPDAVHMPYGEIAQRAITEIPPAAEVVVYCWSPGCNAGAKGAVEFAKLGYRVRELIGGFEYWVRQGYPIADAEGVHRRPIDPLTGVPRIRSRA